MSNREAIFPGLGSENEQGKRCHDVLYEQNTDRNFSVEPRLFLFVAQYFQNNDGAAEAEPGSKDNRFGTRKAKDRSRRPGKESRDSHLE